MARAAFTKIEALQNVRPAAAVVPGLNGVIVQAPPGIDWQVIEAAVRGNGFLMHGHFDLADLAANYATLGAEDRQQAALPMPGQAESWRRLAAADPRLAPGRLLAVAFAELTVRRAVAWDPRLDELGEVLAAATDFWVAVLPPDEAPAAAPVLVLDGLAARIESLRRPTTDPIAWQPIAAARAAVPAATVERLAVAECLTAARMQAVCSAVAAHCDKLAARSTDVERGAALCTLAADCRQLAAAAQLAACYLRF